MNFLDLIIAIPLVFFIYKGWKRGLVFELAMLAGLIVGCYAATHFSTWLVGVLHLGGDTAILIAFFILFIGVLVLALVLAKAIEGFVKLVKVGKANNLLGAAFSMLKGLCIISVLLNMLMMVDSQAEFVTQKTRDNSILYRPTVQAGSRLTAHLRQMVEQERAKQ